MLEKRKIYSEEFRKSRVKEYESGEFTIFEISQMFNISTGAIYKWIYKYSTYNKKSLKVVEMKDSGKQKVLDLQKRNGELERIVGQKQLKIDYLEEMLALVSEEYGIEVKKNSSIPPLPKCINQKSGKVK